MSGSTGRVACTALAACLLAACGQGGDDEGEGTAIAASDPMECAAAISAYSYLIAEGFASADAEMQSKGLVSSMTYLNSYAIPNGLSEQEAFAELETRREALRSSSSTNQIAEQARVCIENTPEV